jgi:hypothetical protein
VRLGWVDSALSIYSVKSGCPLCVERFKSHQVFIPQDAVEAILADAVDRVMVACVQDQLWNNVYSRKFKVL